MAPEPRSSYAGLSVLDEIESRHNDFMETFAGDGFFEEAIIICLRKIEGICSIYFGEKTAKLGLDAMVGKYFSELVREGGWEHALEEEYSGIYSELPIGGLFHNLDAYAHYGIVVAPAGTLEEREVLLREMVETGESFLDAIPLDAWGIASEHAVSLVRKARIRFSLDWGEPVTAADLARITGLAPQSIRNRLAGNSREIVGSANKIEAGDALDWLKSRDDFLPSLWREQDDTDTIKAIDESMDGALFVPMAADRSIFSPRLARDGLYIIGDKGREQRFESFDDALASLQKMWKPVWRRPTETGIWTPVKGVEWVRMHRDSFS